MEQIDWNELDEYWAAQFAEDYAEFVLVHGMAAS